MTLENCSQEIRSRGIAVHHLDDSIKTIKNGRGYWEAMKLLLFADTHHSDKALKILQEKAEKVDVLVCAGDITIAGGNIPTILRRIVEFKKPLMIVHGNHEDEHELESACLKHRHIHFIHRRTLFFDGVIFQGFGGGGFSFRYPDLESITKRFYRDSHGYDRVVFVSHAPPYATRLDKIYGENAGSKSLRDLIRKNHPNIVICGHLHENSGETRIINPGPLGKIISI
jgi:Icc-related predicted phosphoesterase